MTLKTRKGETIFDTDEHVRADAKAEDFAKLRAVFKKDGTVTAGNASGINDGAAAVVLMDGETVAKRGAKPLGRLVAYAHAGVDPKIMGIGPVPATRAALKRAGLSLDQMDVIESNEAFAAQACAVAKDLGFDPEKTNPNGSGISLGHPVGATGDDPDGEGAVRTGADQWPLRPGDDVHRRRPGDRRDLRTGALKGGSKGRRPAVRRHVLHAQSGWAVATPCMI